jgi:hypothetical protein
MNKSKKQDLTPSEKKWGLAPFCKKEDILNLRT